MSAIAEDLRKFEGISSEPNTNEVPPKAEGQKASSGTKPTITREKGQIAFPWYDLEMAISVAKIILDQGGLPMSRDQLAGHLGSSPTSGNFGLKTSAAKMFGLIESPQGKYQLTPLGFAILSKEEAAEKGARAQSFLNVPLYRRVYDEFRGKTLPPRPIGLENAFVQFGVPTKSSAVARQVFERSSRQSGFSNVDPDRLIEPVIAMSSNAERQHAERVSEPPETPARASLQPEQPMISLELDELVRGLLRRLPKQGEKWTPEQKAKWLRTLSQNLDYVVEIEGDKDVVIAVEKD